MNATSVSTIVLSADRGSSTSIATATPKPQAALSVTTDALPTVEIIKMPRPYMRGACLVRCSDIRLSGCFISGPAARAYIASLVKSGQVTA